jgi:hypothetical protein
MTTYTTLRRLASTRIRVQSSLNITRTTNYSFPRKITSWPYLYSPKRNMAPQLKPYFEKVDELAESFIDRLRKAVAIPSISAEDARRPDVVKVSLSS